ncbi:hypothetical protein V8G54_007813 [Vigna mungo]|uniref:Uncharacterized protein n=1 Tax=Vigna mungo TaxID=3915 RepID=A0AAQ3S9A7_VIGMU
MSAFDWSMWKRLKKTKNDMEMEEGGDWRGFHLVGFIFGVSKVGSSFAREKPRDNVLPPTDLPSAKVVSCPPSLHRFEAPTNVETTIDERFEALLKVETTIDVGFEVFRHSFGLSFVLVRWEVGEQCEVCHQETKWVVTKGQITHNLELFSGMLLNRYEDNKPSFQEQQKELQQFREKFVCDWILDIDNFRRNGVLQQLGLL